MSLHRFFLDPERITGDRITFSVEAAGQIERVLRLGPGDRVIVLDGLGDEFIVVLETVGRGVLGRVESRRRNLAEPRTRVALYQGMLKGSRFELVLQKGTEIGVTRFSPVRTSRSVPTEHSESRLRRNRAIVREAAEQCRRGIIPLVGDPLPFDEALREASSRGRVIIFWEEERENRLSSLVPGTEGEHVSVFIGPEGGFSRDEMVLARNLGSEVMTLGNRTLRSETAAIVGAALVLAHYGDLG